MTRAVLIVLTALAAGAASAADIRAKADIRCAPAEAMLEYECRIALADRRTGKPLDGVDVTVGADMPSMPMAHNVRPVKAQAGPEPGVYRVRIELEMIGDWALRIDLGGPVRDRIVKVLIFEESRVEEPAARRSRR